MIAPPFANLEGLMSLDDDLDSEGGSKLERFAHETLDPSLSWKVCTDNTAQPVAMP
jgi:(S)-2-hydroxy-acid oxidase